MQKSLVSIGCLAFLSAFSIFGLKPADAAEPAQEKQTMVRNVQDYVGGYMYRPLIIRDLVSFEMSPKWWSEWNSNRDKGTGSTAYLARGIYDFGKEMGWDDPGKHEKYSSGGSKAEKKKRILNTLNSWQGKFSLVCKVDDPDYDSMSFDLATRYVRSIGGMLGRFKPKAGVVFITMNMTSKAKKIKVTSADGKHITVTLPLDHEPTQWDDKIKQGFKRYDEDTL